MIVKPLLLSFSAGVFVPAKHPHHLMKRFGSSRLLSSNRKEVDPASSIPKQRIIGYHLDEENHWVAELECHHNQHVRHDPPLVTREWVLSAKGRESFLGYPLPCLKCARNEPKDR
jgi:hypothetical protein